MAGIITQTHPGNRVYAPRLNDRKQTLSPIEAREVFAFHFETASTVGLRADAAYVEAGHVVAHLDRLGLELCRKAGA